MPNSPTIIRTTLGATQTCTLFGAEVGNSSISGTTYLSVGYGIDVKDLWRRNLLVLIGFFFLFQLTQVFILEFFPVCFFRLSKFDHTEYGNISNTGGISRSTSLQEKQKRPRSLMQNFVKRNYIWMMFARNKVDCRTKKSKSNKSVDCRILLKVISV